MRSSNLTLAGFLAAAIAVVGLLGIMASTVAPLPLHRAMAREAVFDALLAAPDAYPTLVTQLADSAEAVKPGPDLPARIAAERKAMRLRLRAEAEEATTRLQVMIVVASAMVGLFGAGLLGVGRRARGPG